MKDDEKTKQQLIDELMKIRQRIAELEKAKTKDMFPEQTSKGAEEKLKESEEKYKTLVETSIDMIFTVDLEGNFLFTNSAFDRILGYTKEELKRSNGFELVHPEDIRTVQEQFAPLIEGKRVNNLEYRYKTKRGPYIHIMNNASPIFDPNGNVVAALGVARDITDRVIIEEELRKYRDHLEELVAERTNDLRKSNEALRESEIKWRSLLDNSPDYVTIVDRKGTIQFINRVLPNLVMEEVIGSTVYDYLPLDSQKIHKRALMQVFNTGQTQYIEASGKGPNDSLSWYETRIVPVKEEDQVISAMLITSDITERKYAERIRDAAYKISRAAMSAEDLEGLFRSIHDIIGELMPAKNFYIALYDLESQMLSFPYFVDEIEEQPEPYKIGKGLTECVIRSGQPLLATPDVFEELIRKGDVESIGPPSVDWLGVPLKIKDKTMGILVVQSYSKGVRYGEEDKNILMFVSNQVAMAINRKRAEEQIQKDLKEKEILLKEIHHRVKNNLQIISSLIGLQARQIKDEQALKVFMESRNRIRSIAILHERLYRSGDLMNVDFGTYIKELANRLYQVYNVNQSKVALDIQLEDVFIGIDLAVPCGLVVNELISNSLKHAFPSSFEGKGKIIILLRQIEANEVELLVKDNGIGIPKNIDTRKTESLGLRLVHIIAEEQLDGQVHLNRKSGTEFKIRFKYKA